MTDSCWKPAGTDAPGWQGDGCSGTNQWTPGAYSDSRACIAVACLVVACSPEPTPDWAVASSGYAPICEEAAPPEVGRAFNDGFDEGYA
jgi:hypothetical protein